MNGNDKGLKHKRENSDDKLPCKKLKYSTKMTQNTGHWSQGLKQSIQNPENIILETEHCYVIKDKYPKARQHFLVLTKDDIPNLKSLKINHVSLLQNMIDVGKDFVKTEKSKFPNVEFKVGFHAIPSMSLLHMHVISTDFDSACLKTKRHWNSFTSEFFRPAELILADLKEKGMINLNAVYFKQYLENELECHVCSMKPKNMPKLKEHIRIHFSERK